MAPANVQLRDSGGGQSSCSSEMQGNYLIRVERGVTVSCLLIVSGNGAMILRLVFKKDALGSEVLQIALPAALALAADPVASLIDTAFIGRLGLFCSGKVLQSVSWSRNLPF